ncbi:helix-turn-helix transcriptional regulator [Metapseudomonas furukawaii]|uniref:winged helix-turn-helix transcriptional regulator n=1 Tax=Metapseudomonas furukawaii TaxID=1149133 RepID=UPI00227B4537|nr:helix-turn-helix domain-containing protein [Pseudomonas furukawaii]WAG80982.1 helix-turn-helix transcriptional regulator [Pseudomonas furukawaii]
MRLLEVTIFFIVDQVKRRDVGLFMKRSTLADRYCSIARSSSELTDAWSFVILRELFLANMRFDGLQAQTGMSPRSLTLRLGDLESADIVKRVAYQQSPVRYEYRLTSKGKELWPVVVALKQWGDKWSGPWVDDQPPLTLHHKDHAHELELGFICKVCGEPVDAHSSTATQSSAMTAEREQHAADYQEAIRSKRKGAAGRD